MHPLDTLAAHSMGTVEAALNLLQQQRDLVMKDADSDGAAHRMWIKSLYSNSCRPHPMQLVYGSSNLEPNDLTYIMEQLLVELPESKLLWSMERRR